MTHTVDFVKQYYPYAIESEDQTRIPALFTLAQAALETGWGKKAIGSNLFGIAADKNWTGAKVLVDTFEYHDTKDVEYPVIKSITYEPDVKKYRYEVKRYFREYKDVSECFNDHNNFLLKDRYKKAFDHLDDPKKFAAEVANGGYATGHGYAETLARLIDTISQIVTENGFHEKKFEDKATAKVAADLINLRVSPNADAKIVYKPGLKKYTRMHLISYTDEWYKVKVEVEGWVAARYIDKRVMRKDIVDVAALNFRAEPNGEIVAQPLARGTEVKVLDEKAEWAKIEVELVGWVDKRYVDVK